MDNYFKEFTIDDWNMLTDALDALKNRDVSNNMIEDIFGTLSVPAGDKKGMEEYLEKRKAINQERAEQSKLQNYKIDLLKAKIIMIREANINGH